MKRSKSIRIENKDTVYEIKKHSSLVQMGNIATLQERKAMNALIRIAKDQLKRHEKARKFQCSIGLIKRLSGIKDTSNEELKSALRSLQTTSFEYNVLNKDSHKWGIFSFVADVWIQKFWRGRETLVSFEFPTTILDVIKHPRLYVKLDLAVLKGLESKHAMALYEAIKDYEKLKKYKFEIGAFRSLMGIRAEQYTIFAMFRKRVIDRAVMEINARTDIIVSYDVIREGRRVSAIMFHFKSNKGWAVDGAPDESSIMSRLQKFWIGLKKAQEIVNQHNHSYLIANIQIVEEQMKKRGVRNPAGYLLKAIQNDYRPEDQIIQEEKIKKHIQSEKETQKSTENEQTLKDQFQSYKNEIMNQKLEWLASMDLDAYKNQFLEEMRNHNFFSKLLESKGFDDAILQIQRRRYLEWICLSDEERDFEKYIEMQ